MLTSAKSQTGLQKMLHHSTLQAPEAEKIFGDHRNPREAHGCLTRPCFEGRALWQGRRPPPCPRHCKPKPSIRFSSPAVEVILRAFPFPSSPIIWDRAGGFHPLTRRTHPSSHTKDSVPQAHSLFPWQICCSPTWHRPGHILAAVQMQHITSREFCFWQAFSSRMVNSSLFVFTHEEQILHYWRDLTCTNNWSKLIVFSKSSHWL